MLKRHFLCRWVSEDPPAWKWTRRFLTSLGFLTAIISIYALVQRTYLYTTIAPDNPARMEQLPWLLSVEIPLPLELAVYSLLGYLGMLYFQGQIIRLFVYYTLNKMCPLATPTLSDRIRYAQHGSSWIHNRTQSLHNHVKNLEERKGLSFTKHGLEDFLQLSFQIAKMLKTQRSVEHVIAITPIESKPNRHALSMNLWDTFLQNCGAKKTVRFCYYLIDSHTIYDQNNYVPWMEKISSCFDVASRRLGQVRIVYRNYPDHAVIDEFIKSHHAHYLAVKQKGKKWLLLTALLGMYDTGFYGGMVLEQLDLTKLSDEGKDLASLVEFNNSARKTFPKWQMTDNEKAGRHVYNFMQLKTNDHAWFIDWAFMLKGWNDDFLQQIREATVDAIKRGIDVRRIFVVPESRLDKDAFNEARAEARRQVPTQDSDKYIEQHMGYVTCPDMTHEWWNSIAQASEANIAKERADFALYTFQDSTNTLYVNNFNGAPKETDSSTIDSAKEVFQQVWANRRKFA